MWETGSLTSDQPPSWVPEFVVVAAVSPASLFPPQSLLLAGPRGSTVAVSKLVPLTPWLQADHHNLPIVNRPFSVQGRIWTAHTTATTQSRPEGGIGPRDATQDSFSGLGEWRQKDGIAGMVCC